MRWPWAIAATVCAPLLFRAAALVDAAGRVSPVDVQGLLSDLGVAALGAVCVVALLRVHRLLALLFVWLWTVAHYANYELVVTLGAPATLRDTHYLFDPTFFVGSAIQLSQPGLLALAVGFSTLALWLGAGAARARAPVVALAGLLLVGVASLLPDVPEQPVWRQVDFLQRDAGRLADDWLARSDAEASALAPPDALIERLPELAADLSGEPRIAASPRARNVLLIALESLSGLHVESLAREQGREPDADMPDLDAFAQQSLRYVNFVAHQRKTNRGLYALLCGELPNLGDGTPKMSASAESPWRVCLPEMLRRAGYQTAYLQAAPLAFMLKDRFMASAGFERVDGYDGNEPSYTDSAWGVDDRAFFEEALHEIETLREGDAPWFLTLLNVGTHHPYTVPEDFEPGPRSFRRAAAYLDRAFGAFIAQLEQSGALDDTLLVVTSDESTGIAGFDTEPLFKGLSQNWGLLLLRGPAVPEGVVREPFGLSDLALSIGDYLGLADRAGHFFGRSVFRHYSDPRHLIFGNGNLGTLGAFEPAGTLLACSGAGQCRRYAVPDQRWFGVLGEPTPLGDDDAGVQLLHDLALRSQPGGGHRPDVYALMPEPTVELHDDRPHMLHGGQFVHLTPDEWLEVTYDVAVEADGPVEVDWVHSLSGFRNEKLVSRRRQLHAGQHLHIHYRYVPDGEKGQLQARTTVRLVSGESARLRHGEATLRIHRGDRPAVGSQVLRFEVDEG